MKKRELAIIVPVILFSVLLLLINKKDVGEYVTVTCAKEEIAHVPLSENREIDVRDTNVVVIENGEVYMKSAFCPDELCVLCAPISKGGEKIICLPNRVIVEIIGKSETDTVVR